MAASLLALSVVSKPVLFAAISLGVTEYDGGTSITGLLVKKFRGLKRSVMPSAGMMGKSSGEGKCVMPNVCHRTMSVLATFWVPLPTQVPSPLEGIPDDWTTWSPAAQSSSSESKQGASQCP